MSGDTQAPERYSLWVSDEVGAVEFVRADLVAQMVEALGSAIDAAETLTARLKEARFAQPDREAMRLAFLIAEDAINALALYDSLTRGGDHGA